MLFVRDSGEGIPAGKLDRIWDRLGQRVALVVQLAPHEARLWTRSDLCGNGRT